MGALGVTAVEQGCGLGRQQYELTDILGRAGAGTLAPGGTVNGQWLRWGWSQVHKGVGVLPLDADA
jgi:hypothetical protein